MRVARGLSLCLIFLLTVSAAAAPADASQIRANAVSAGSFHTVILDSNGTVWAWGADMLGQCGDKRAGNAPRMQLTPVQAEISGVKDISAGSVFTLALMDDGTVWAWGANTWGQLGTRLDAAHPLPAVVPGLSNVTSISAGSGFSLALKDDGTVWAWGHNECGQLGDGIYDGSGGFSNNTQDGYYASSVPYTIDVPKNVENISAYLEEAYRNIPSASAQASTEAVDALNSWYEAHNSTPGEVIGLSGIQFISAYDNNALAVDRSGNIWAWGSYRLNMSTLNGFSTPAKFGVLKNVASVSRNGFLTSDGRVYVLTFNSGKLTRDPQGVPYDLVEVPGLTNVTKVSFGKGYYVALKDDETVWTWGDNHLGQLGDGTSKSRPAPVMVYGLSNITCISSGEDHTIAISGDGTIWGWGSDNCGQLGDGDSGEGLYKKSPAIAKFAADMKPNTLSVTPIPEAGASTGVAGPSLPVSGFLDSLVSGLFNNPVIIGSTIILLLACGGLYLAMKKKK